MRIISQFLPLQTRKCLYNALLLPHIDYCCVVWHDCGVKLAQEIERIQKYGMSDHIISPSDTSAELRKKLQWTTLTDCKELFRLSTVHRCLHNNAVRFQMCLKFRTNSSLGYSHTRGYNNIHLEKPNMGKSFEFQGVIKWNWLPKYTKELSSNTVFKKCD